MKFCGQISIEFPAADYFSIAEHRRRLEEILSFIRSSYPDATLAVKERRERKAVLELVGREGDRVRVEIVGEAGGEVDLVALARAFWSRSA